MKAARAAASNAAAELLTGVRFRPERGGTFRERRGSRDRDQLAVPALAPRL